jgi:hypothetical protein
MRWLYHITHQIPKWRPGPPPVGDIWDQIQEMSQILVELEAVDPGVARALQPMQAEFARAQRAMVRTAPLERPGRAEKGSIDPPCRAEASPGTLTPLMPS